MAPHSSTLDWKIPWTEEPCRLQSMGSLRVRHDRVTSLSLFTFMHWRRKCQPTPVFLPGESQGRRGLVGCRLWGHTESDTTEATQQQQQQRDGLTFFFFWNEKIGRLFLFTLAVFPNQLISRHHQFTEELNDLLLCFPFLPPLQCVLLAWPVNRRKCLKRRGLEIREMITAK